MSPDTVRPLRPRLVIRSSKDGSLEFAATSDIEIIIVREGFGNFRAFPYLQLGIERVRGLLSGRSRPAQSDHKARREA